MISGESSSQPSPPPPDSLFVTAQLEGSTLTRAQYKAISGLTSSLLCTTTGDLVYDGHTLHPLTLHWHCPAIHSRFKSHYFLTEMAQNGMTRLSIGTETVVIPQLSVSTSTNSIYSAIYILYFSGDQPVQCCFGWRFGISEMCSGNRSVCGLLYNICKTRALKIKFLAICNVYWCQCMTFLSAFKPMVLGALLNKCLYVSLGRETMCELNSLSFAKIHNAP